MVYFYWKFIFSSILVHFSVHFGSPTSKSPKYVTFCVIWPTFGPNLTTLHLKKVRKFVEHIADSQFRSFFSTFWLTYFKKSQICHILCYLTHFWPKSDNTASKKSEEIRRTHSRQSIQIFFQYILAHLLQKVPDLSHFVPFIFCYINIGSHELEIRNR